MGVLHKSAVLFGNRRNLNEEKLEEGTGSCGLFLGGIAGFCAFVYNQFLCPLE